MFTEYEIESLIEIEKIKEVSFELQKDFVIKEAPYLEISNQDFLSLILMVPTVGVALANGSVSLFEEMALNKKARKLSKGGYFLKKDPIVFALKYVIKRYDMWGDEFLKVIRKIMEHSLDIQSLEKDFDKSAEISMAQYRREVLKSPYIFIRFVSSFFLDSDDDIFTKRNLSKVDHQRMVEIGEKLDLHKIPVFHYFCKTFDVK